MFMFEVLSRNDVNFGPENSFEVFLRIKQHKITISGQLHEFYTKCVVSFTIGLLVILHMLELCLY